MTSRTATLIGLAAILMWSLLAVMTVATGHIPAFQLAAMTFAIGGLAGCTSWLFRPEGVSALRQPTVVWLVGVEGCSAIMRCISSRCNRRRPPKRAS